MAAHEKRRLFLVGVIGLFFGTVALFGLFLATGVGHPERWNNEASVIGVGAAVVPNEYNILAEELKRKEAELAEREAALRAGTANTPLATRERDPLLVVSVAAAIILFALLLLNFYLDWRRERRQRPEARVFAGHVGIHEGELQTRL